MRRGDEGKGERLPLNFGSLFVDRGLGHSGSPLPSFLFFVCDESLALVPADFLRVWLRSGFLFPLRILDVELFQLGGAGGSKAQFFPSSKALLFGFFSVSR